MCTPRDGLGTRDVPMVGRSMGGHVFPQICMWNRGVCGLTTVGLGASCPTVLPPGASTAQQAGSDTGGQSGVGGLVQLLLGALRWSCHHCNASLACPQQGGGMGSHNSAVVTGAQCCCHHCQKPYANCAAIVRCSPPTWPLLLLGGQGTLCYGTAVGAEFLVLAALSLPSPLPPPTWGPGSWRPLCGSEGGWGGGFVGQE